MNIKSVLQQVNRSKLTNNTQRVALRLLSANGEWVSRGSLNYISSATARVRDLRKDEYGGFRVECASALELNKRGDNRTFFYRILPSTVSKQQIQTLLPLKSTQTV